MMALRACGGPGQLACGQAPVPAYGPGEARIAVRAAAITAGLTWDLSWTAGDS
jgi:NADPH:quinone reductase-like Zn-dependent oxidoreductase